VVEIEEKAHESEDVALKSTESIIISFFILIIFFGGWKA
jgi:hypothetical protein